MAESKSQLKDRIARLEAVIKSDSEYLERVEEDFDNLHGAWFPVVDAAVRLAAWSETLDALNDPNGEFSDSYETDQYGRLAQLGYQRALNDIEFHAMRVSGFSAPEVARVNTDE